MLMVCSLILFFTVVEIATRILVEDPPKSDRGMLQKSLNPLISYELTPNFKGVYAGSYVSINSQGMRDFEYSTNKSDDTFRIIILGDSFTFGEGVAQDSNYPTLLEKKLNSYIYKKKYEVLNFGVSGYNTIQEAELLKNKSLKYNPDLVIVGYFIDDVEETKSFGRKPLQIKRTLLLRLYEFIIEHFYFAKYIQFRLSDLTSKIGIVLFPEYGTYFSSLYNNSSLNYVKTKKEFEKMANLTERENIKILVVIFPVMTNLNDAYPYFSMHNQIIEECMNNNFHILDLFPYFKGKDVRDSIIGVYDAHPNEDSYKIAAEAIHKKLIGENLIPDASDKLKKN